jgi:hypothetical protein
MHNRGRGVLLEPLCSPHIRHFCGELEAVTRRFYTGLTTTMSDPYGNQEL